MTRQRLRTRLARARAAALALATGVMLAACGSGLPSPLDPLSALLGAGSPVRFLVDYMKDWYLWTDRLPRFIDASRWSTPEEALDALRVEEDRYSFIASADSFNAFFDDGRALGYGFGYAIVDTQVIVRSVQPASNAATAGLRRGDRIIAVDGKPTPGLVAAGTFDDALGPVVEGQRAVLSVQRGGATIEFAMARGWYEVASVLESRAIDTADGRVGYLAFYTFTEPARTQWDTALDGLRAAGVRDLIIDLRENGGGRLSVANHVASSLAPPEAASLRSLHLEFNDRHVDANESFEFEQGTGFAGRVIWITGAGTCSASESVIAALMPYRVKAQIGAATCGKPVGFTPPEYEGKVYNIVTFRSKNRDGYTDYFQGIAPDCMVPEDYDHAFGDPAEARLAAALAWLRDGRCVAAQTKSFVPPRAAAPDRGLDALTGRLR